MVSSPGMAMVFPLQIRDFRRLAGDDHGAVFVAHAAAATGQGVFVGHIRIGVNGDGGDFQFAGSGPLVQGLDVLQHVLELIRAAVQQVLGQAVEHEGVVRIRGMSEAEELFWHRGYSITWIGLHRICAILPYQAGGADTGADSNPVTPVCLQEKT